MAIMKPSWVWRWSIASLPTWKRWFLPAAPDLEHISSSIVKDVARHGGDVTGMVPDCVIPLLGEALNNEKRA